jgi:hemolysin activation/secretion protein
VGTAVTLMAGSGAAAQPVIEDILPGDDRGAAFQPVAAPAVDLPRSADAEDEAAAPVVEGVRGAEGDGAVTPSLDRDGLAYRVSRLRFEYALPHDDLPGVETFAEVVVPLTPVTGGYVGPVAGAEVEPVRLGSFDGTRTAVLYGSAVAAVNEAVRLHLERAHGLMGHLVTPSGEEIDFETTREDLREPGNTTLSVLIWRAAVGEVRTVGYGQKWDRYRKQGQEGEEEFERAGEVNHDNRVHTRIRERSPVQAGDVLRRPELDRFVYHLNRHPGRRVDVSLAPTGDPGDVVLDYMVTEAKDWLVYANVANTGTPSTDDWVYRFGYINNQLTDRDDILQIDYITAGFDESHTVLGSYDFRISPSGRTRARVYGRWNQYTAGDVGLGFDDFEGSGWEAGGEVAHNFYQRGPFFLDLVGGARYEHIEVENDSLLIDGEGDFLIPYVGLRAVRNTALSSLYADLSFDFGFALDTQSVEALGRTNVDEDWTALRGSASYSFFLEPLLNPAGFRGEKTPDQMTLAHEIYLGGRGQYAFGNRLIPNYQQVAGGFYTVRGYDESVAVGDDVIIGTAEYRYHLGKAGAQGTELKSLFGRPFRSARTEPYGSADWDLILRGFADAARVLNNDRDAASETDATLVGVGVGVELRLKNNVTVRADYGIALTGVGEGALRRADSGDSRLHFSATLAY